MLSADAPGAAGPPTTVLAAQRIAPAAPSHHNGCVTEYDPHSQSTPVDTEGVASLERLSRTECLDLLALAHVGRVGFLVDGHPEILPVNYALDGDAILFRTAEGSALNQVSLANVAFEVDAIDESMRSGWSVLVRGHATDIGDTIDPTSERLRRLTLVTWAPGQRQRWYVIRPQAITGRRLRVLPQEL
jgi:nitroimidazol reductase NimA-like FMN-containing flavoprotein (pyridoxamine 5'-phosphate oxidase superfamily)